MGPSSDWYPDRYPCPSCGERCAVSTKHGEGPITYLSAFEAFSAFNGAGLPGEQECSASRVSELLKGCSIKDVLVRHIKGTNRCTLDQIQLNDGTVLFLGASTHGACVYRVRVREHHG